MRADDNKTTTAATTTTTNEQEPFYSHSHSLKMNRTKEKKCKQMRKDSESKRQSSVFYSLCGASRRVVAAYLIHSPVYNICRAVRLPVLLLLLLCACVPIVLGPLLLFNSFCVFFLRVVFFLFYCKRIYSFACARSFV